MSECIHIGDYTILWLDEKLWIRHEEDEGGEFSEEALAAVIEKFFMENF